MSFFNNIMSYFNNCDSSAYECKKYKFKSFESIGDFVHGDSTCFTGIFIQNLKLFYYVWNNSLHVQKMDNVPENYNFVENVTVSSDIAREIVNFYDQTRTVKEIEKNMIKKLIF